MKSLLEITALADAEGISIEAYLYRELQLYHGVLKEVLDYNEFVRGYERLKTAAMVDKVKETVSRNEEQ